MEKNKIRFITGFSQNDSKHVEVCIRRRSVKFRIIKDNTIISDIEIFDEDIDVLANMLLNRNNEDYDIT